jgi:hypothetical protein
MDHTERGFMESRFRQDFSGVRIHTGGAADASARAIDAQAYTVGRDIVFRTGAYAPGSQRSRKLLAHELTHVVQQGGIAAAPQRMPTLISHPHDAAEREAVANSERIADRGPLGVAHSQVSVVQRDTGGIVAGVLGGVVGVGLIAGLAAWASRGKKGMALTQNNINGASATRGYTSEASITFTPDDTMHCDEISFVQAIRMADTASGTSFDTRPHVPDRQTASGWALDRVEDRKYGWYGYNNDGRPAGGISAGSAPSPLTPATMIDSPGFNKPNTTWQFESCAICRSGTDANKVYDCLHWGFTVDGQNKLTSTKTSETPAPSAEFSQTIAQWNKQAAGPAAKRNDPNQQPMGPMR